MISQKSWCKKKSEVEAVQIEEGTVEKRQDHDPGENVNRVGWDTVSGQVRNTNEVTIYIFT